MPGRDTDRKKNKDQIVNMIKEAMEKRKDKIKCKEQKISTNNNNNLVQLNKKLNNTHIY